MNASDIQRLRDCCKDFKNFRDLTVDGNGNNLHDIKGSFDYVKKSIDDYHLTGTKYGSNLSEKAEQAGNVLSQLWTCLENLENSVEAFCQEQEKNNG